MIKKIIGIFGSAIEGSAVVNKKARQLGEVLAEYKNEIILINGACPGLPYLVVSQAAKKGVEAWGFSPAVDWQGQEKETQGLDISFYKKIIYLPENLPFINDINVSRKYRNVILTASCQAGIIVGGRFGTLNEFTNLYDMGKIIGVFTGTEGAADVIDYLLKKINKASTSRIFFDSDPEKLVKRIIQQLKSKKDSPPNRRTVLQ